MTQVDIGAQFSAFGAGGDILTIVGVRRNSTPDIVASLVWDEVR